MEKWINTLKSVASKEFTSDAVGGTEQYKAATSGEHVWYVSSHARPTYCNVCREALSGVAWHGLSCEGKIWRLPGSGTLDGAGRVLMAEVGVAGRLWGELARIPREGGTNDYIELSPTEVD